MELCFPNRRNLPLHPVAAIRSFNRFYTRQIGLLNERLYDSAWSLSEVRILYELARRESSCASELTKDLGLDAGYLSRLLAGFEKRGFLEKTPAKQDRRQLLLSLTSHGREAFARIDAASSREISSLLSKLSATELKRLVDAMAEIQRILGDARKPQPPYILRPHQPGDLGWIVHRHGVLYSQEYGYDERFEALVAEIVAEFVRSLDPKRERCWIAERDGENVGCVMLVKKSKTVAKLRLLLVEPSARGMGIGKRLVEECIRFGRRSGYKKIILWTQSELDGARHIYREAGFLLIGEQPHNSWSRNHLVAETWELKL
jgi:DNA-binding MarR family transcriptional regulator/N-acetylglutamate synthase-like GNAT family acetyltransferase